MVAMQESVQGAMRILKQLIPAAINDSFLLEEIETVPLKDNLGWQITISFAIPNPKSYIRARYFQHFALILSEK